MGALHEKSASVRLASFKQAAGPALCALALVAGSWARDAAAQPAAKGAAEHDAGHGSAPAAPTPAAKGAAEHDAGHGGAPAASTPAGEGGHEGHGASGHDARAKGEHGGEGSGHAAGAAHEHEGGGAHEHEASTEVAIDMVFGTGRRIGGAEGEVEGEGGEGGEGEGAGEGEAEGANVVAFSSVMEASHQFTPAFRAAVFVPFSHGTITPAGEAVFSETVLGNLALAFVYGRDVAPGLGVKMGLLVAAPTAGGDRFATGESGRREGEVNEWSALTRAYAEDELFVPHRLSAVPSFGLEHRWTDFDVGASFKMPILVRDGGVDPPTRSGLSESSVAIELIPAAYGFLKVPSAHLALGASAYAVYFAVDEVRSLRSPSGTTESRLQPVVEPEARLTLNPLRMTVGYITPLGGRLGRYDQRAGGVHVALGAEL